MTAAGVLRWLGAGLIVCGGLLARRELLSGERRSARTRRELAEAFEETAAEIRTLLTPLPAMLRRPRAQSAQRFFRDVLDGLERGGTLDAVWRCAAEKLALPEEERAVVASLGARLGGGAEETCAALTFAASELRRAYARAEEKRGERERLITSLCLCISLLFAILLL